MRVLLIEDEPTLHTSLLTQLRAAGFSVEGAHDGEAGLYFATEYPIDVAIIDLGLPKLPGLEVIKRLRAAGRSYPILILTARDQWQEKVAGLQSGADDYVTKPFHFPEVLARVQALLRRSGGWADAVLQAGPLALDPRTQQVTVTGHIVELTSYEYRLLEYLMHHPGEVITKSALTEHLYAQDFERDSNTVEVFIGRLRKKLDPQEQYHPIETVRGRGYRFALPRNIQTLP